MPAPRLTNPPPVRVLIVGVRDYDAPWAHPAEGALHDAIGWWRYAVLSLGIAPESIRVLTNPPLGERQLAAGVAAEDPAERAALVELAARTRRGRATGAAIAKGIDWLRSWDGQQLLTFSGHGIAHPALATTKGAALGVLPAFAFAGSDHARLSVDEYERMFQLWREGENLPGLASLGALQPPLRRVIVGDATQGPPPVDQSEPEVARRPPALTRPDWAAPLGEAIRAGKEEKNKEIKKSKKN